MLYGGLLIGGGGVKFEDRLTFEQKQIQAGENESINLLRNPSKKKKEL